MNVYVRVFVYQCVCVRACVCASVREKERESERGRFNLVAEGEPATIIFSKLLNPPRLKYNIYSRVRHL